MLLLLLCHLQFTSNANHLWIGLYGKRFVIYFFTDCSIAVFKRADHYRSQTWGTHECGANLMSHSHVPFIYESIDAKKNVAQIICRNHSVHESYQKMRRLWTDKYSTWLNYEKLFEMRQTRPVIMASQWIWLLWSNLATNIFVSPNCCYHWPISVSFI